MTGGEQFNYAPFSPEVRNRLGELEAVILEGKKRLTCSGAVIGTALVEAKAHCARMLVVLPGLRISNRGRPNSI